MAPTMADMVFISHMYLAGGFCPVLLVPFVSFKDVAQGPFLLVLRLGPGAKVLLSCRVMIGSRDCVMATLMR